MIHYIIIPPQKQNMKTYTLLRLHNKATILLIMIGNANEKGENLIRQLETYNAENDKLKKFPLYNPTQAQQRIDTNIKVMARLIVYYRGIVDRIASISNENI